MIYGVLKDKKVVRMEGGDQLAWARSFEEKDRVVARTVLNKRRRIFVSTIFLGIDHGWSSPQWFETMVFGTSIHQAQNRYETYEEAEEGHKRMVKRARQARQLRNRPLNLKKATRALRAMRRFL